MTVIESSAGQAAVAEARALFEEARRRRRRRRRWIGLAVLVVALVVGASLLAGGGGSKRFPSPRSHHPEGKGSTGINNAEASSPAPRRPPADVYEVGQTGSSSGWAMSGETLYVTTDMGSTWRAATLPTYFTGRSVSELVHDVASLGQNDLWIAVGDVIGAVPLTQPAGGSVREEGIIRSADGGATWSFVELPGCLQLCGGASSVSFVDALHGFAAIGPDQSTQTKLFSTGDGGIIWQEVSVLPGVVSGAQISFTSLSDGWAVTDPSFDDENPVQSGNALLRTSDGGLTWQSVPSLPDNSLYEAPAFFGRQDGAVVRYGPAPTVFTTADGGATWASHPVPLPRGGPAVPLSEYQAVPFSAPTATTWFLLTPRALIETTDAGAHWHTVTTQIASSTGIGQSLFFFSSTDGWAIAPEPGCRSNNCGTELLTTKNAGRTWTAVSP